MELPKELEAIEVYHLKNDVFGLEKILSNGNYTVYLSDFECVELYERAATIIVKAEFGSDKYVYFPRGELDYLICFKSNSGAELENDRWIFSNAIEFP